jgi:hypothetical protein
VKTGDLFKLVPGHPENENVEVGMGADRSIYLPPGTLVVYVRHKHSDEFVHQTDGGFGDWDTIDILVDGVIGWVYFHELEPADETR